MNVRLEQVTQEIYGTSVTLTNGVEGATLELRGDAFLIGNHTIALESYNTLSSLKSTLATDRLLIQVKEPESLGSADAASGNL